MTGFRDDIDYFVEINEGRQQYVDAGIRRIGHRAVMTTLTGGGLVTAEFLTNLGAVDGILGFAGTFVFAWPLVRFGPAASERGELREEHDKWQQCIKIDSLLPKMEEDVIPERAFTYFELEKNSIDAEYWMADFNGVDFEKDSHMYALDAIEAAVEKAKKADIFDPQRDDFVYFVSVVNESLKLLDKFDEKEIAKSTYEGIVKLLDKTMPIAKKEAVLSWDEYFRTIQTEEVKRKLIEQFLAC